MTKVYHTLRFGKLEIREEDVIVIPEGLLGFAQCRRYILLEDPSQAPFQWLQSLDNTDLSFALVDPLVIKPDYQIQVPKEEVECLGIDDPQKARVFVMVVVPKDLSEVTANLRGPIVVNPENRRARQVVLMDDRYPTRYAFLKEIQKEEQAEPKA